MSNAPATVAAVRGHGARGRSLRENLPRTGSVSSASDTKPEPTGASVAFAITADGSTGDLSPAATPRAVGASGGAGRAEGPTSLENITVTVTRSDKDAGQRSRRQSRFAARVAVQEFTNQKRLKACGRLSVLVEGKVQLRSTGQSAGFGGLASCGRVWLCPVCSAKIAMVRAAELEQILTWNTERGGSTLLMTLTIRHHKGQGLARLWHDGIRDSWRYMTQRPAWRKVRKELGMDHYVRATELTYGEKHGNHVHLHVLLFCDRPISQDMSQAFGAQLFDLWQRAVRRQGFETVFEAFDIRVATEAAHLETLSDYLVKATYNGLAFETVGGQGKVGKKIGNRTPFQVLAEIIETGRADLIEWWWEFEAASDRQRQITTSRGLKKLAGLDEIDDEEIVEQELDGDVLLTISRDSWRLMYRVASELLDVTETHGVQGATAWLDVRGLEYELGDTTIGRAMQRTMQSKLDRRSFRFDSSSRG